MDDHHHNGILCAFVCFADCNLFRLPGLHPISNKANGALLHLLAQVFEEKR